jgi:hypothetical protein
MKAGSIVDGDKDLEGIQHGRLVEIEDDSPEKMRVIGQIVFVCCLKRLIICTGAGRTGSGLPTSKCAAPTCG